MAPNGSPYTIGIEEEYLLVNPYSRNLASDPPSELLEECEAQHIGQVSPELMRSQIEVGTKVCESVCEAREELRKLRATVSEVAQNYGLVPIAAGTHPFARWSHQKHTPKARYATLASELQTVGRRLVTCGMHIHVGIDNPDTRIDLLNQITYFLPHLLAFTTSSPFWDGYDTGLKSYRLSVFDGLPRTGLPESFESYAQYQRFFRIMADAGLVEDATKLWWDVRPSSRYPTLELRITDVCTSLDDAISVAALYICLLRMLERLKRNNQRWRHYMPSLIKENRWRAQRYGLDEGLVDFGKRRVIPWPQLIDELLELIDEDARALDCVNEVQNLHNIHQRGTSAHWQLSTYHQAKQAGASEEKAMQAVVDMLINETIQGVLESPLAWVGEP